MTVYVVALRNGDKRRAVNVRSFCHFPSSCKGGLTLKGNKGFSGVMALFIWARVTTAFVNTALNETLSGTVPVGAKLLTPCGIPERDCADMAGDEMRSIIMKNGRKNLLALNKIKHSFLFMG